MSGKWKFGFGPQLRLATHTDAKLEGADWGAGLVSVVTGPLTKELGLALITGHMWGFETGFRTSILQPALTCDFPCAPGWYVVAPDGGAEWSLRFGVNLMFP